MTIADFLAIALFLACLVGLTPLLGRYIALVLEGKDLVFTRPLTHVERALYRVCGIDPTEEMHWKKYAISLTWFSALGGLFLFVFALFQHLLPLNPQNLSGVSLALAFNIATSFVTNTNWQSYSGESALSYFTQAIGLTVQNFASASVGMAVLVALIRGIMRKNMSSIGNFWVDITRSFLFVLLPLSVILSLMLMSEGVVQNFSSYESAVTLEGKPQVLPMGPAASQIAIKQLGSNGGGFFGANSAHPFENPTPLTNFLQMLLILLLPSALVYAFGVMTNEFMHARMIYMVMLILFLSALFVSLWAEYSPQGALAGLQGLEGKEWRFGKTASILWSTATTAASNGAVNAMHDSLTPLAGGVAMMQILLGEVIFGGVGSGLYGMLLFILLTVFLAGLMVGRTPEYLGKKIEAFDIQMAVVGIVLPSAVVLLGCALTSLLPMTLQVVKNAGPHGFTELLYAWGSAANNNGSAFAGLDASGTFFNCALGIAMVVGRFGVIFAVLAIAGNLASKKIVPTTGATFSVDTPTFAVLLGIVVIVIGALTFFPSFLLGPVLEHFLAVGGRTF